MLILYEVYYLYIKFRFIAKLRSWIYIYMYIVYTSSLDYLQIELSNVSNLFLLAIVYNEK